MKIQGKEFTTPSRITNRMIIDAQRIEGEGGQWFMDEERTNKMMRIVLEGPHDDVDWMDEEVTVTLRAYKDFFTEYAKRIKELTDTSSSE